jgi:hypothetical protein
MDRLQKQALEKHKIIRYKDLFVKVMDTYKTLLEAETEQLRLGAVVGRSEQLFCHTCKNEMPENEGGNCCSKCWNEKYGAK